jgi:hypothetical protein
MSSLYRDKINFAKPTAAQDFSPELGIWIGDAAQIRDRYVRKKNRVSTTWKAALQRRVEGARKLIAASAASSLSS